MIYKNTLVIYCDDCVSGASNLRCQEVKSYNTALKVEQHSGVCVGKARCRLAQDFPRKAVQGQLGAQHRAPARLSLKPLLGKVCFELYFVREVVRKLS